MTNRLARDKMNPENAVPPMVIRELALVPGSEWLPNPSGWLVFHASAGAGYLLHPQATCELVAGSVTLLSDRMRARVRASQAGEFRMHYFRIEPSRLAGLVTFAEQNILRQAATDPGFSLRVAAPNAERSERFRNLSAAEVGGTLPARVQLLQLFLELLGARFEPPRAESPDCLDARERLRQALQQTPLADLIKPGFANLASRTRCSPRHLSRLFTELVGVSFREKQAELRLGRACELLATTDSKVAEVALECGYQSTSLFSVVFKGRFGVSPARWRHRARGNRLVKTPIRRLQLAA